jgi:hypothetical protein
MPDTDQMYFKFAAVVLTPVRFAVEVRSCGLDMFTCKAAAGLSSVGPSFSGLEASRLTD